MKNEQFSFADLFRRLRVLSGFFSLKELSDTLLEQGIFIDSSILSRWQTGDRIPRSRESVLLIIQAFYKRGGLSETEANDLLSSAQLGYLTDKEKEEIFEIKT